MHYKLNSDFERGFFFWLLYEITYKFYRSKFYVNGIFYLLYFLIYLSISHFYLYFVNEIQHNATYINFLCNFLIQMIAEAYVGIVKDQFWNFLRETLTVKQFPIS